MPERELGSLAKRRAERKREGRQPQGRVVSSYYSATDMEIITAVAEAEGIALGGLQHEALMLYIEERERKKQNEQGLTLGLDAAFAKVVEELGPVKKEWLSGRLADPQGAFGEPTPKDFVERRKPPVVEE